MKSNISENQETYPLLLKKKTMSNAFGPYIPKKGNKVALIRSRVTKRTKCFFKSNVQIATFKSALFGFVRCKITVRDKRTVAKYGGFDKYLFKVKRNHLSPELRAMKDSLMDYLSLELNITSRHLSHKESANTKPMILEYIENRSLPSSLRS